MPRHRVTGATRLVALVGDPVERSLSPAIHNAAFRAQGLDLVYLACPVVKGGLADAVRGLWEIGALGANVTIPHKQTAFREATTASPVARALGAANTLVRRSEGWHADNTDVEGFLAPLQEMKALVRGRDVVVLGAGGAARSVVYGCSTALGVRSVGIAARRVEQARGLARDLQPATDARLDALALADAADAVRGAALVVNATPLGMGDGRTPWTDETDFHPDHIVYDLVYRPALTPLLAAAAARGARTVAGLPMLLGQAAAAYRQWTGRPFPYDVARNAARDALS